MARIRSQGNKETELEIIRLFRKGGIAGWRRNWPVPGRPDFVFPKARLALFVDGCFWHGCPRCFRRPSSNQEYWDTKIARNRARDRSVTRKLRIQGWSVLRVWHHDLSVKRQAHTAQRIQRALAPSGALVIS